MSHHWIGYWDQRGYGRQTMENLVLQFQNGQILGRGDDVIGPFTFAGKMAPGGRVLLDKQYIGQHNVLYEGEFDGEGTIFGQWSLDSWERGEFILRLHRSSANHSAEHAIEHPTDLPD